MRYGKVRTVFLGMAYSFVDDTAEFEILIDEELFVHGIFDLFGKIARKVLGEPCFYGGPETPGCPSWARWDKLQIWPVPGATVCLGIEDGYDLFPFQIVMYIDRGEPSH